MTDPSLASPVGPRLDQLMTTVRAAQLEVDGLRAGRVDPMLLDGAREVLLDALESYAAELVRRRLPTPPGLRDALRLQQGIRSSNRGADGRRHRR
ncbi:hypothetical protein GCM10023258_06070 [Terrabacter aeriphilus]|uniref:Uncharacterized protein n=1 Tax=Terrabacter aeriphilus TaxID=515662 RepID=A0ABP9J4X5_9MICO